MSGEQGNFLIISDHRRLALRKNIKSNTMEKMCQEVQETVGDAISPPQKNLRCLPNDRLRLT